MKWIPTYRQLPPFSTLVFVTDGKGWGGIAERIGTPDSWDWYHSHDTLWLHNGRWKSETGIMTQDFVRAWHPMISVPEEFDYDTASDVDTAKKLLLRRKHGTRVVIPMPENMHRFRETLSRAMKRHGLRLRSKCNDGFMEIRVEPRTPRLTGEGLDPDWNIEWELKPQRNGE